MIYFCFHNFRVFGLLFSSDESFHTALRSVVLRLSSGDKNCGKKLFEVIVLEGCIARFVSRTRQV